MPRTTNNKNDNDPRAIRSVRDIKNAMLTLIGQEPYDRIEVKQILRLAPISMTTFYKYFESKADVLDAIRSDLLDELTQGLKSLEPQALGGG